VPIINVAPILSAVGNVTVIEGAGVTVQVVGTTIATAVGSVNVWGEIEPAPGNSWNGITPSGGVWTEMAPAVASSWTAITPSSGSWNDVTPGVTPDWTDIAA
jgi:hypothetical protein